MVRKRNLYNPNSTSLYRFSCTKLEDSLGVSTATRIPIYFKLSGRRVTEAGIWYLSCEEKRHQYMLEAGIDAVPAQHRELEIWRQNFKGVSVDDKPTGFTLFGAIHDLWLGRETSDISCAITRRPRKMGKWTWMLPGRFHINDRWKFINGCSEMDSM